ncbi:MAG: DUF3348 family protein [Oceanicoccus sp.]
MSHIAMTQVADNANANNPRMIRFLAELKVAGEPISHTRFAERLAQLIDLSDSLKLSVTHSNMPELAFKPVSASADAIKEEFLRVHAVIVEGILNSFTGGGKRQWAELPGPDSLLSPTPEEALQPFLDFYRLHQQQMSSKVKGLRSHVRNAASGLSVELAQLAQLDLVLADTLAAPSRGFLANVAPLLGKRFEPLLIEAQLLPPAEQADNDGLMPLYGRLCGELQSLLLAEVEVHLLPVLGLVEAIDDEMN